MSRKLSVVVPVYNGALSIVSLFDRIATVCESQKLDYEVVFVEDCGRDNSWEVIQGIKKEHPDNVIAVKLSKNFGQHNATMCGLKLATGDVMVTIDDDLQIPPEEILKLLEVFDRESPDLVYGVYTEGKQHNAFRNLGSNFVQAVIRKAFGTTGDITSFRMMSKDLVERISSSSQSQVFLDGLVHWHTSEIARVPVKHEARTLGKSNYDIKRLVLLTSHLLFNFTTIPLRISAYLGLFFSVSSFLLAIFFVIRKIIWEVPIGYTSIIVTIFFTGGIILLVLGVIGEYLSRMYTSQHHKPQYSINKII